MIRRLSLNRMATSPVRSQLSLVKSKGKNDENRRLRLCLDSRNLCLCAGAPEFSHCSRVACGAAPQLPSDCRLESERCATPARSVCLRHCSSHQLHGGLRTLRVAVQRTSLGDLPEQQGASSNRQAQHALHSSGVQRFYCPNREAQGGSKCRLCSSASIECAESIEDGHRVPVSCEERVANVTLLV